MTHRYSIGYYLCLALLVSATTGCLNRNAVELKHTAPAVKSIVEHHNEYVAADETLDADTQAAYISEAAGLQLMLESHAGKFIDAVRIQPAVVSVTTRYDTYVDNDSTLLDVERKTFKLRSAILRENLRIAIEEK